MLSALLIKNNWLELILSGEKTWEIRGTSTAQRGLVALVPSGSGTIVGVCRIVDAIGPMSLDELNRDRSLAGFREPLRTIRYARPHAWVLEGAVRLANPVAYKHPPGAVIWVTLAPEVELAVRAQVPEEERLEALRTGARLISTGELPDAMATSTTVRKSRGSKLDAYVHLLGVETDAVVGRRAGVTREAVRVYRTRLGIPSARDGGPATKQPLSKEPAAVVKADEELPPEPGEPSAAEKMTTASGAAPLEGGRKRSAEERLAPYRDQLGHVDDATIAELAGVTRGVVGAYRRKLRIAAYDGYLWTTGRRPKGEAGAEAALVSTVGGPSGSAEKITKPEVATAFEKSTHGEPAALRPSPSRLDAVRDLIGVLPDREVAAQVGLARGDVQMYRTKYGIPAATHSARQGEWSMEKEPSLLGQAGDSETATETAGPVAASEPMPITPAKSVKTPKPPSDSSKPESLHKTTSKPSGKAGRRSRIEAVRELIGVLPDAEVAVRAGVSQTAIQIYRENRQIPAPPKVERLKAALPEPLVEESEVSAMTDTASSVPVAEPVTKTKPTRKGSKGTGGEVAKAKVAKAKGSKPKGAPSKLDAVRHLVGVEFDRMVGARVGLTASAVQMYRSTHGIPAVSKARGDGGTAPTTTTAATMAPSTFNPVVKPSARSSTTTASLVEEPTAVVEIPAPVETSGTAPVTKAEPQPETAAPLALVEAPARPSLLEASPMAVEAAVPPTPLKERKLAAWKIVLMLGDEEVTRFAVTTDVMAAAALAAAAGDVRRIEWVGEGLG